MIHRLQSPSLSKQVRSEALQRTVTAALSAAFALIFLLLLDNLLLEQLKTRVIDRAMDRVQTLQRMNFQTIEQWYGHEARHLAFWRESQQLRVLLNGTASVAERSLALAQRMAAIKSLYPELRDVAVFNSAGTTLLSTQLPLIGMPIPLAESSDAMQSLRSSGFVVSTLYIVAGDGVAEHRLIMAQAMGEDRFVAIALSPDSSYAKGPAGAEKDITNYMVDPARKLYRFDHVAPQGAPFQTVGTEHWYRNSGISWPAIRKLALKEGHVEWRNAYSGVGGEQVFGRWSWHAELGVGLLSEIRVDDALAFYQQVHDRVILITVVTVLLFALALLVTTLLHIYLFGSRAPGPLLRLWLRLAPWPWPITMLVFTIVIGAGTASSLRDFAERGDREIAMRLDAALGMTVRSLDFWHDMELANARLWASSTVVADAVHALANGACLQPTSVCEPEQALRRRLAPLVRNQDHYGFDVLTADGNVIASSDDFLNGAILDNANFYNGKSRGSRPHLLASDLRVLTRARDEKAAISGVLSSVQALPGDHGEYRTAQPVLFVVAPVPAQNPQAYLALHVDPRAGFFRASEMSRFGITGDAYLVGESGALLSQPRLGVENDEALTLESLLPKQSHGDDGASALLYADYRGVEVIGRVYFDTMLGAYIVNKVDAAEALVAVRSVLRLLVLIAVISITTFIGTLSSQYLVLRQRMAFQLEGAQPQRDVWANWGSHPKLMSAAVALGVFFIDALIVALMSRFELGDSGVLWFATAAMLTAVLLPFIHLLILKPATHANLLLSQLLSRSEEQEERYRGISEQLTHANAELQRIARVDELTGIANRRHLDDVMNYEIGRCQRSGQSLALLLLDVDYFKRYNDNYGHPKGDEVLKTLGSLLRQTVSRTSDLVARYGGEEFCAVLPNTGVDNAVRIAEKILQAIQQAQIPHEYSSIAKHVTVSIGVYASVPSVRDTSAHFYQQADIALYQAKGAGRNQIRVMADN